MEYPVLSAEHLTKRFEEQDAVYDISFSISQGEILAFYGQAGSGKTTLLKLAAGVLSPTSGNLSLCGKPLIPGNPENAFKIGLMLNGQGLYQRLTVREYLTYFQRLYGVKKSRVDEVISQAGLIDRRGQKLANFSESLFARLRMARVMLHSPQLLLLDEPTSNLEIETTEILRKMILKAADEGTAVILATSFQEEAYTMANRIVRLQRGRIEGFENTENIKQITEEPNSRYIQKTYKIEKIPAKINDKIILFNPTELTYIESQEGNSVLHSGNEAFQCPMTLAELEGKLTLFGFFRCHRSYIVNLQRVREVIPWTRNSYSLILDDASKTSIPLSKNSLKELEERLGM